MSTVAVVEVLWKDSQGITKRNLAVASDSLVGMLKLQHPESVLVSALNSYIKTLICLPLPVAT